jgi:hypothetical protein
MAERGPFTTTEPLPLLTERGITLSASQVHRLVTGTPERLSLQSPTTYRQIYAEGPGRLARLDPSVS